MTASTHLREAERLLAEAGEYDALDGAAVALVQRAQTHAMIALAMTTRDT